MNHLDSEPESHTEKSLRTLKARNRSKERSRRGSQNNLPLSHQKEKSSFEIQCLQNDIRLDGKKANSNRNGPAHKKHGGRNPTTPHSQKENESNSKGKCLKSTLEQKMEIVQTCKSTKESQKEQHWQRSLDTGSVEKEKLTGEDTCSKEFPLNKEYSISSNKRQHRKSLTIFLSPSNNESARKDVDNTRSQVIEAPSKQYHPIRPRRKPSRIIYRREQDEKQTRDAYRQGSNHKQSNQPSKSKLQAKKNSKRSQQSRETSRASRIQCKDHGKSNGDPISRRRSQPARSYHHRTRKDSEREKNNGTAQFAEPHLTVSQTMKNDKEHDDEMVLPTKTKNIGTSDCRNTNKNMVQPELKRKRRQMVNSEAQGRSQRKNLLRKNKPLQENIQTDLTSTPTKAYSTDSDSCQCESDVDAIDLDKARVASKMGRKVGRVLPRAIQNFHQNGQRQYISLLLNYIMVRRYKVNRTIKGNLLQGNQPIKDLKFFGFPDPQEAEDVRLLSPS